VRADLCDEIMRRSIADEREVAQHDVVALEVGPRPDGDRGRRRRNGAHRRRPPYPDAARS
jgi:hypothetical protein